MLESANVDMLCASRAIAPGEVVFTQETLPECEMAFCADPNCELRMQPDGAVAIVALRRIAPDEWITLADPDSDDEGGEPPDSGEEP